MTNYVEPTPVAPRPQPREERVIRDEPINMSPYPVHNIPRKRTFVKEEEPEKYDHPPEDYRSVVGYD